MCLYNNPQKVRKFLAKAKKLGHKYVTAYKKVEIHKGKIFGLFFTDYEYKVDFNVSNSERRSPFLKNGNINRGIHVFLNKYEAERTCFYYNECLIKVKCEVEDLFGISCDYSSHAVFRKIYIGKAEYEKALKQKENQRVY